MNKHIIDKNTHDVLNDCAITALSKRHLLEAIDNISAIIHYCTDDTLLTALETYAENYRSLLNFATQGITDNERNEHIAQLVIKLNDLLTSANRDIRLQHNESAYTKAYNQLVEAYGPDISSALHDRWNQNLTPDERLEVQDHLFNFLWTQPLWTTKDTAQWFEFISRQNELVQPHLAGAIFLSAYEYTDIEKLTLLCLLNKTENKRLRAITSVGAWLIRLTREKILDVLKAENTVILTNTTSSQFVKAERERLLMILSIIDQEKEDQEIAQLTNVLSMDGMKEAIRLKVAHSKNRIKKGLDVNLNKVSMLHGCSFLKECSHWWLPFDKTLPQFQNVMMSKDGQLKKNLSRLTDIIFDCDVDMLALLYTISTSNHADDMIAPLDNMELPEEAQNGVAPDFSIKKTIQNIYRFFHHSPMKNELRSPFDNRFCIYDIFIEGYLIGLEDNVKLCKLLAENMQYDIVCETLPAIIQREGANAETLNVLAKCYMEQGQYSQAYNYYKQAIMLNEENLNSLYNLQMCCIHLRRFEEANEYLQLIKSTKPDFPQIDNLLARSLIIMEKYEDALQILFKADFENPGDADTILAIIECCMNLDKLDTADKYCTQLMVGNMWGQETNLLYCGHVSMLQGNWKEALRRYLIYFDMMKDRYGNSLQKSMQSFEESKYIIPANKISNEDFLLMYEMIVYSR